MRIAQREKTQFIEAIYNRYKVPLYGVIRKYLGCKDSMDDVFQEVIVRIIKNAELLSTLPQPKLEAYIFLVARRVAIDHLRTLSKEDVIYLERDAVLDILSCGNRHTATQMDSVGKVDLIIMMEKIPAEDRILLIGKYYLELSSKEIADLVGCPPTTVRSRIFRARKKLLEEWTQSGLRMEDFLDE